MPCAACRGYARRPMHALHTTTACRHTHFTAPDCGACTPHLHTLTLRATPAHLLPCRAFPFVLYWYFVTHTRCTCLSLLCLQPCNPLPPPAPHYRPTCALPLWDNRWTNMPPSLAGGLGGQAGWVAGRAGRGGQAGPFQQVAGQTATNGQTWACTGGPHSHTYAPPPASPALLPAPT